jgi:WD40 repeat protein
MAKREDLG